MKSANARINYCLIVVFAILLQVGSIVLFLKVFLPAAGPAGYAIIIYLPLLCLIFSAILLPLAVAFWREGFRGKRFGKTTLITGIICINFVLLLLIYGSIHYKLSLNEDVELLGHSSLVQLDETVITYGRDPIGVHLNMQIDMPAKWAEKHSLCSKWWMVFDAKKEHNVFDRFLQPSNEKDVCEFSIDKTQYRVHHQVDYYPMGIFLAETNRLCIFPFEKIHSYFREVLNGVTATKGSDYIPLNVTYYDAPFSESTEIDIMNHLHFLKDPAFWNKAEQNLSAEHLQASGFRECPKNDRLYTTATCYCKHID